jgi:cytochrome c-type biogenesis protein CcmE
MVANKITKLIIISISMLSILVLMFLTVDPEIQYSVDEVMANPEKFENIDVFMRGEVDNSSLLSESSVFTISGVYHGILVDYSGASLPDGFQEGLTVAVKGKLVQVNDDWKILASEIITGCPSKYETIDNS